MPSSCCESKSSVLMSKQPVETLKFRYIHLTVAAESWLAGVYLNRSFSSYSCCYKNAFLIFCQPVRSGWLISFSQFLFWNKYFKTQMELKTCVVFNFHSMSCGKKCRQAKRKMWLRQRRCMKINALLKPLSGNLTKGSEPQAATGMLLQSWPCEISSTGQPLMPSSSSVSALADSSAHLGITDPSNSVAFEAFFLVNTLNRHIVATEVPHMSLAGCYSKQEGNKFMGSTLQVRHP